MTEKPPKPITIYGATDCDDTERTRNLLLEWGVPFREVDIDQDSNAERFVTIINNGFRSTPTLVIGEGNPKAIWTEPTDTEVEQIVKDAGYTS